MEESELIYQVKDQNPKAFSYLVDLYSTMVYSVAIKMVNNKEDAEDITQEVFTTIWTSIDSFKGESLLKTWIFRLAINKSHEFLRKKNRKKRKGFHFDLEEVKHIQTNQELQPDKLIELDELQDLFNQSLNKLPVNQKTAFLLSRFEEMSYQEIADEMKISHSAVESLIFRARQKLSVLMQKTKIQ